MSLFIVLAQFKSTLTDLICILLDHNGGCFYFLMASRYFKCVYLLCMYVHYFLLNKLSHLLTDLLSHEIDCHHGHIQCVSLMTHTQCMVTLQHDSPSPIFVGFFFPVLFFIQGGGIGDLLKTCRYPGVTFYLWMGLI